MNLFSDPMAAAFIPLLLLLAVGWSMFALLGRQDQDHGWWINMLQGLRLVPKEPEPETPIGTRTNVLHLSPPELARDAPKPVDYRPVIQRSRVIFRNVSLVVLLLTAVHAFNFYRRSNPYFIWGPEPTKFATPEQRGTLPPRVPGAGGAGASPFGSAPTQPPQMVPPPGGVPTPGTGMPAGR